MTRNEFLFQAKKSVYESIAVHTNEIVTGNKTSSAIATLFTNVPVDITLRKIPYSAPKKKKLWSLSQNMSAYLKHDDGFKIYFTYFYTEDKDLPKLLKATEKHTEYFGYVYLREMLKLTQNLNTRTYFDMASRYLSTTTINPESYYAYICAAADFSTNNSVKAIYDAGKHSNIIDKLLKHQRYSKDYKGDTLSILQKLVLSDFEVAPWGETQDFTYTEQDDVEVLQFTDFALNDEFEEQIIDLGVSLNNALSEASRGTATAQIFAETFASVPIQPGQLKKLKKSLKRRVFHMTQDYTSTWAGLNTTYRHKFKSPSKKFFDYKLNIVLSIDVSGSVGTQALGKLLALIEELGNKIVKLTVIQFDTEIIKQFHLENVDGITKDPQFTAAVATRYAAGGTSNIAVCKYLDELPQDEREKMIYFNFSDNYSDIPACWKAYPSMSKLTTFLIAPIDNPVLGLKGDVTNVYLT